MFTPFAFFQNAVVAGAAPASFTGYYIGGAFTNYNTNADPYFRMLNSTGSISSSFNIGTGFSNTVTSAVTQSDGKIIVGGNFTTYSGSTSPRIVRINTDGTRDLTFNPGSGGATGQTNAVVVQADGKIVLGGVFLTYSGSGATRIARANTNGTIDSGSTWNTGAGFESNVNSIAIQADQKILVGGQFTTYSGSTKNRIARLNTNGTADTGSSWNQGTGFQSIVQAIAIQPDQKILVGGQFTTYSSSTATRIVRLNTSGTLDTTFGSSANNAVYSIAIQNDGKIVIGGAFVTVSGSTQNYIARLNSNGTLDNTFTIGSGFNSTVFSLGLQSDGKILVQGTFTSYSGSIAPGVVRLNTDGTLDTTFNPNMSINTANNPGIFLQLSNGSIILGNTFTNYKNAYLNFLDSSGNPTAKSVVSSYGFNSTVSTLISQSDGKIVAGGAFTTYSGSTKNYIVRIDANGTAETGSSWNIGAGFNGTVRASALQSDNKIIVGGDFTTYSGSSPARIARLNTNGTLDTTFNPGTTGVNQSVYSMAVQADQKIVVVGQFTTYSGSTKNYIARANTDGTADTGSSWNTGTGFNDAANVLLVQPDQKIIVGGAFTTYSGSTKSGIARLNTDGTADTGSSWNQGAGINQSVGNGVFAAALQSDGKIVAGGTFTSYSGSSSPRIVRINADGTKDTTFNPGSGGANSTINSMTIEPDTGKILIGGNFTTYSGSTVNRIVRINTNGTRDTTFSPTGSGFDSTVNVILPY